MRDEFWHIFCEMKVYLKEPMADKEDILEWISITYIESKTYSIIKIEPFTGL